MKICYIILAHKNPQQVSRLVNRLAEPWTTFYIHIDANKEIEPFKTNIPNRNKVVFLEGKERRAGTWGDIGIVKATLNAIQKIVTNVQSGYCILLSGQDYPIVNNLTILNYLKKHMGTNYSDIFSLPYPGWESGGLNRIKKYKINKSIHRGHFIQMPSVFEREFYTFETVGRINFLRKTGNYDAILHLFSKRNFPRYLKPYGGQQWWALTIETLNLILKFLDTYPDYINYHKYTLLPDEIFFNSILMHLDNIVLMPSLTYVDWSRKNVPLPVTFTLENYPALIEKSENFLFARKFDSELDTPILNKIDKKLLK